MLFILLSLFITSVQAVTLESHCAQYDLTSSGIAKMDVRPENCLEDKLSKGFDKIVFSAPGGDDRHIIVIHNKIQDAEFCKIPSDVISIFDKNDSSKKELWNSMDNFKKTILMTASVEVLKRNNSESEKNRQNTCYAFPDLVRINKFKKNRVPGDLKKLINGGYMLLSGRLRTIFFMDPSMKNVEYFMNFPEKYIIKDALLSDNGDLYTLTFNTSIYLNPGYVCLERWDIGSGTMMSSRCDLKSYSEQILVNIDGEIQHAFQVNETLNLEKMSPGKVTKVFSVPVSKKFVLTKAFVFDGDMRNIESEMRGQLKQR